MRKIVIPILTLLLLPMVVLAADELTFDADTTIELDSGATVVIGSGSIADEMVINVSNIQFTMSSGSSVTITSAEMNVLTNSLGLATACASTASLTLPAQATQTVVTVTPNPNQTCTGGGGGTSPTPTPTPTPTPGGGGGADTTTPSKSTNVIGEATISASGGGTVTATTDEDGTASVELPVGAVSDSTVIKVAPIEKVTVTALYPLPSGKNMVGGYAYNYTATANEKTISSFSSDITLTFKYTDSQIAGLNEDTLQINYWDGIQWVVLDGIVDKANNKIVALTNHFTYFAILGEVAIEESEGDVTIVDGDLIRNPNAEGLAQFDIYIVKLIGIKKFKRLILSPHVFESYEHFDKNGNGNPWDDVLDVSQVTMDAQITSDLVRAVGDAKVYKLIAAGDTGTKQWLNITATQFNESYDSDSIYEINATDRNAYTTGADIMLGGSASETIIITVSTLKVRSLPSLEGEILTNVSEGEVYSLLDESEGWYKITANGVTGWCYSGDTGGYATKQ